MKVQRDWMQDQEAILSSLNKKPDESDDDQATDDEQVNPTDDEHVNPDEQFDPTDVEQVIPTGDQGCQKVCFSYQKSQFG
jgi:hypothetical protein